MGTLAMSDSQGFVTRSVRGTPDAPIHSRGNHRWAWRVLLTTSENADLGVTLANRVGNNEDAGSG
jgi:hypothetical protein